MAKRGLGKGLSALIADSDENISAESAKATARESGAEKLPLNKIQPGRFQPRHQFDEEALSELADSVRRNGVVQPILVRNSGTNFEIIAGERRWRAAKIAGLTEIPAIRMELTDKQALEIALVENIQRRDLSPLEVAEGYQRLLDEFSYTQEELSEVVGKSRSHVTNMLRLLSLPTQVKEYLASDKLSIGHARALIGAEAAEDIAEQVVKQGLNVRQTEKLVQERAEFPRQQVKTQRKIKERDPDILALEKLVSANLGMAVTIHNRGEKGAVEIAYQSLADLDKLLRRLEGTDAQENAA